MQQGIDEQREGAIRGAGWLQELALPLTVTLLLFVLLTAFVNLFIGSASAKWALLAPVFVPMLLLAGLSPEATQVAYRIGDSYIYQVTNMSTGAEEKPFRYIITDITDKEIIFNNGVLSAAI